MRQFVCSMWFPMSSLKGSSVYAFQFTLFDRSVNSLFILVEDPNIHVGYQLGQHIWHITQPCVRVTIPTVTGHIISWTAYNRSIKRGVFTQAPPPPHPPTPTPPTPPPPPPPPTQIGRFRTVTLVWMHWWLWNDVQSLKQHKRVPYTCSCSRSFVKFQGHMGQKIADFDTCFLFS